MLRDTVDSIDWSYMRATDLSRLADQYHRKVAPGPRLNSRASVGR